MHVQLCQVWVRRDGPYGYNKFDYRRYGVLMLVGGGVGIAPIIGLLKDIYGPSRKASQHFALCKTNRAFVCRFGAP